MSEGKGKVKKYLVLLFLYLSLQYQMMIRGPLAVLAILAIVASSSSFEKIEVTRAQRNINLSGPYAGQTIKISFVANEDNVFHFTYLTPLQYQNRISKIWFSKNEKDKTSLVYFKSTFVYEGVTYMKYKVYLPHNYQVGDIGDLTVHIVYLYRYVNLPASIGLTEDQKVQYEDVKFMVSPYHIVDQQTSYKMMRVYDHESDGIKKGGEVQFNKGSIEPFTVIRHTVFGVNNNPLVEFTEVEKIIEVSHWGNVGITENYKIINKGPSLKGEFSRVTFGSRGGEVKNAWKGIEFDLPYQIWGLYYRDEVGNVSTSKAYRDESYETVRVGLTPRFSLVGGWKSNWELGYNFNTDNHLFHDGNKYQLRNIKVEYALEKVLTQQFTVKVILPEGAHNVKLNIGGHEYNETSLEVTTSEGYLDFNGRPTYIIPNFHGITSGKNIEVSYDFSEQLVYKKPMMLGLIVLGFLVFAIFLKRFKLQAFAQKQE